MARVLVAEDDRDVRELCLFALKFAGYETMGVCNGDEAIQQIKLFQPDIIIMDVRIPTLNGIEACKALNADPSTSSIPIIFLSVRGNKGEEQAGLDAGAVDYIIKPITPDDLIEKVKYNLLKSKKKNGRSTNSSRKTIP